jgi:tRNA U38,U39,U40 pseudouridine synthase TruA
MIVRTRTPISLIAKTFTQVKINIPKAPALGLLLERVIVINLKRRKFHLLILISSNFFLACI